MTEFTREILDKYQVRKSGKQKAEFRDLVISYAEQKGYSARVEKGMLGAKNIVVGDVGRAKVVYTAHYDTCAVLPFPNFITPKNFGIYLLYQLLITVILLAVMGLVGFIAGLGLGALSALWEDCLLVDEISSLFGFLIFLAVLLLLTSGPANKHTVNDNTSGVTTLIEIMAALPEKNKNDVAFVFFDLEEAGLFGSAGFASKHKKEMKDKPLINFDCVSDGENMLFVTRPKARYLKEALEKAFPSTDKVKSEVPTSWIFYPSDQANFPQGVGVAALLKSKKFGILYMDKIHTPKDRVYREENIEFLTEGSIKLAEMLGDKE